MVLQGYIPFAYPGNRPIVGAGVPSIWRRCVFVMGTGAAKQALTHSSGAGVTSTVTLAPSMAGTCARGGLAFLVFFHRFVVAVAAEGLVGVLFA